MMVNPCCCHRLPEDSVIKTAGPFFAKPLPDDFYGRRAADASGQRGLRHRAAVRRVETASGDRGVSRCRMPLETVAMAICGQVSVMEQANLAAHEKDHHKKGRWAARRNGGRRRILAEPSAIGPRGAALPVTAPCFNPQVA